MKRKFVQVVFLKKLKLAVLASTRGTDLQAVIDEIQAGRLDAELRVVISDKPDAPALEKARSQGFNALFVDEAGKPREEYDGELVKLLEKEQIELVVLIGYMRLLGENFVKAYENRIINVHPSLLPAFPGMDLNVHQAVLDAGCKVSGCTVHFVDAGTDTGAIILQKAVEVKEGDTAETLKQRVQEAEKEILPKAIQLFAEGRLKLDGKKVFVKE